MTRPAIWTHDRQHFYKYVSAPTAMSILRTGRLRWSAPLRFNDPFDVQFDLHIEYDETTIVSKVLEELWRAYRGERTLVAGNLIAAVAVPARNLNLSRDQFDAEFKEAVEQGIAQGQRVLPEIQDDARRIISDTKVLCLSELYDNILMWSHYAQDHQGAVLRFSCVEHLDSVWGVAKPVRYETKMPLLLTENELIQLMSGQKNIDTEETLDKALYSKAADWSYEKEWRIAGGNFSSAPFNDVEFHVEELTGIYLGCRIAPSDQEVILNLARTTYPKAELFEGRKSDKSFSLVFTQL